jgi:Jhy protein
MGGLGANIGSEDWEKAQKKKEAAVTYAENVRQTIKPSSKLRGPIQKEQTSRQRALDFARQVPKPKVRASG